MQIESALQTHTGLRRTQNQDRGLAAPELDLYVVADGMGGHQGGETASRMAVEGLSKILRSHQAKMSRDDAGPLDPKQALLDAVSRTNQEIHAWAEQTPSLSGMGTTLTAAWFPRGKSESIPMLVAQIGDSRCYLHEPGSFWQLTVDHSYVQSLVNAKIIAAKDARRHPERNRINRSMGYEADTETDLFQYQPLPGQTFLLCSDGLNSLVEDSTIFDILEKHLKSADPAKPVGKLKLDAAALELVDAANAAGGDDNITVLLVRIHG